VAGFTICTVRRQPLHTRERHTHKSRSVRLSRSRRGAACWRTASWWRSAKISAWSSTRVRRLDRMAATRPMTLGCIPCTVLGETGKLNRHKRYRLSGGHRAAALQGWHERCESKGSRTDLSSRASGPRNSMKIDGALTKLPGSRLGRSAGRRRGEDETDFRPCERLGVKFRGPTRQLGEKSIKPRRMTFLAINTIELLDTMWSAGRRRLEPVN
jgi:hypothetical protein